ncbi:hypothetical protein FUAX_50140 (plasmid) [Fulvitalea axinellae]|uniref:Uncharacterized protein n=1 Tax=Fulvitalea axinellae TaxID=1182444 RepID=A0AAU9CXP8_9BACT|nr:hypothetical protein FUAX_50140 [Fulvitalea axinellae]
MLYQIKNDLRIKLNQVDLPEDYFADSVNSIYNLECSNFRNYKLDLTKLILSCQGKLTDFASQVFCTNGI